MSPKGFATTFANTLPDDVVDAVYDDYVVPAPGRPYFQASLGIGNAVSFRKLTSPLLLIAGLKDKTADPSMIKRVWRAYDKANAPAEFAAYPNRSHFLFAEESWEEIADGVLAWLTKEGFAPTPQLSLIAAEERSGLHIGQASMQSPAPLRCSKQCYARWWPKADRPFSGP